MRAIRTEIRSWDLHLRSDKSIEDLSRMFNPIVRGWLQYYGRFYRSALYPLLRRINAYLVRWARKKYKRPKTFKRARAWWKAVTQREPLLFAQWRWVHSFW